MKNKIILCCFFLLLLITSCDDKAVNQTGITPQDIYISQFLDGVTYETYTINSNGTNKQLINDKLSIISEPKAGKILIAKYDSLYYGDSWCFYNLTVMSILGNNVVTLPVPNYHAVFAGLSNDASKVFFTYKTDHSLYIINSNGTSLIQISNEINNMKMVDFSPDSKKIAFIETSSGIFSRLVISDVTGANKLIIKDSLLSPDESYSGLDWSPDGTKIVFGSLFNDITANTIINSIDIDGSNFKTLTNPNYWAHCPSWSSNGKFIVFLSYDSTGTGIFIMNADGSNKKIVVRKMQNEHFSIPRWHYNENKILFTTRWFAIKGNTRIYDVDAGTLSTVTSDSTYEAYWNYVKLVP